MQNGDVDPECDIMTYWGCFILKLFKSNGLICMTSSEL